MAPDEVLALAKVLESLYKAPNEVFDVIYVVPTETPEDIEEAPAEVSFVKEWTITLSKEDGRG